MAEITNPWLGYFDRSYEQIKKSLLQRMVNANPEMTDHSEGNILVVILGMFAGVGEMLGVYIDTMAREAFLSTALRFSSIVKLIRPLDYRIKSYIPSTVDITISTVDGLGSPVILTADYLIPINTRIKTVNGVEFITTKPVIILAGQSEVVAPAKQQVKVTGDVLGVTTGVSGQEVILITQYADGTMEIYINSEFWELKDTLGLSGPLDKHYIIDVNENKAPYIKFGNGTNGKIPTSSFNIIGAYYTTNGKAGNDVNPDTINTFISVLTPPAGVTTIKATNTINPSGGTDIQDIDAVRISAPLSLRTLMRAVTRQDFRDLLRLAPGVAKGDVLFNCGKSIDMYIIPKSGTIASLGLLQTTQDFMEGKKILGRLLVAKAAGTSQMIMSVTIYGRYRQDAALIQSLAEAALLDYGNINNLDINQKVPISDIYAKIDNIPQVDYLEINSFYLEPYARPVFNNLQLTWQRVILPGALIKASYRLVYAGGSIFNVYRELIKQPDITVGVLYTNNEIQLTIQPGAYTYGDNWIFTIYPYGKSIDLDDYTLPIFSPGSTSYTVIENLVGP